MKRIVTKYEVTARNPKGRTCVFGFLADLHNGPYQDVLSCVTGVDAILLAGDLLDRHHPGTEISERFLEEAPDIAPVFMSLGNHEVRSDDWPAFEKIVLRSRVRLLDDDMVDFHGIVLGGLSSREREKHKLEPQAVPEIREFVRRMAACEGFKLLMCHHPEYYDSCIREGGIDLTVSGHAHGGQVQLFGQGLYAPGQGLFPRYTDGFYDGNHLLVSRGVTNSTWAPRLWNPCEVILLTVKY